MPTEYVKDVKSVMSQNPPKEVTPSDGTSAVSAEEDLSVIHYPTVDLAHVGSPLKLKCAKCDGLTAHLFFPIDVYKINADKASTELRRRLLLCQHCGNLALRK